jgi:alginate O-acetyltransferase complex protein AlgI
MLFSSPPFFIFFAVYLLLHVLLPARLRLPLIIVGSTVFYGYWDWRFTPFPFLLLGLAVVGTGWMDRADDPSVRTRRLVVTIVALITPLVFFKYINFLYRDVYGLLFPTAHEPLLLQLPFGLGLTLFPSPGKLMDVVMPLGISFVTFTFMGYAVDVYRRREKLAASTTSLTGAVMFFPHLIAGPVVLPRQLIWQIENPTGPSRALFLDGIMIFTVGLVKKLVFADQIALAVNPVFREAGSWSGAEYLLAILGFSMQIYCDFSGYSDMAIGLAKVLGVELPKNFDRPYSSASVVEFWQRWHITLSSWLRDYLYVPLGGNRHGVYKQVRNVLITMGLGGLWHGARWTFVVWGLAHGAVIALTHLMRYWGWKDALKTIPDAVKVAATFLFVTVLWVPFRAENMEQTWRVLSGPFTAGWPNLAEFASAHAFLLTLLGLFFVTHRLDNIVRIRYFVRRTSAELYWAVVLVLWTVAIAISAGTSAEFIYFDF